MEYNILIAKAIEIEGMLRYGYDKDTLMKNVKDYSEEAFVLAKARIKNKKEGKIDEKYIFTEEDLRFCTNQEIARYRAERLKCDTIVDIGSGIGIQAIEFAKTCKKVIAIEIDKRKIEFSKINAEIADVKNIEFINEDALSALAEIKSAHVIFWDPERPDSEVERTLESMKPGFSELIEMAEKVTTSIVVELPPQIGRDKITKPVEFEYISLNNDLNRMNVYLGSLKKCKLSVVSLPSGERFEYDGEAVKEGVTTKLGQFLYEIDEAIARAGLASQFAAKLDGAKIIFLGLKEYITSDNTQASKFLKAYSVIRVVHRNELKMFLSKNGFNRVIIHGNVAEGEYSMQRKALEKGLKGKHTSHVFFDRDEAVVCAKIIRA